MPQETNPQWRNGWKDHAIVLKMALEYARDLEPDGPHKDGMTKAILILHEHQVPPRFTR